MASSFHMRLRTLMVLSLLGVGLPRCVAGADSLEELQGFSCAQEHAAQAWTPMAGSPAVSVTSVAGKAAFRMPCNFHGTNLERASWDHPIRQDLAMCQGVQFLFYCADPSPVANFTLYLHSGDGWYRGVFDTPVAGQWVPVRVAKADMEMEGNPAGWSKIDTIRISAWRGQDRNTEFYVADFALFGGDAKIVILRGDSAAQSAPSEMGSVRQYTSTMASLLDRVNLPYLVLSDRDIAARRLGRARLIILPHNPAMPEEVTEEIARFLQSDGTLLACYHLPRKLASMAGIDVGGHVRQPSDGYFASIRPSEEPLRDMPAVTQQASWNIQDARPADPNAHVAAWWYTNQGDSTGKAAIVAGAKCVYLTHVLQSDDLANKVQLLLAMMGHLVPSLWSDAAQGALDRIGRFGPYDGYESAQQGITQLDADVDRAGAELARADECRRQGLALVSEGEFAAAMAAAEESRRALLEAYCLTQQPLADEHRAFWCHSAFGVAGMDWDEAIRRLADNGFTAILPNMLWGGVAFYRSDVLPPYKDIDERGDQIERCLAACKRYGVECHVWKVNYNMGGSTDKAFVERMRALGRVQVSSDGSVNERWLCPSHPENQQLEVESMLEVARKYDVDGLHFDYIRYPGREGCFCAGCRLRFEEAIGKRVENWPSATREDSELEQKWLEFRRQQITSVVAAVAAQARQIRPQIKVSAAVFRNWPVDRDTVGQDWRLWCEKGYLDFVCPMDYFSSSTTFEYAVANQLEWVGSVPCYPGIGLSVWTDPTDVAKLIEMVNVTRKLKTGGFTVFNYGPREARDVLPLLGKGLTRVEPVDMARRAQELKSLKWGMFICWSFSTFSGREWTPGVTDVSFFKATGCDTDQWARTAKEAGMGYILFLTKHHDGFCLWDTKTTDRKVTNAPLGRDVLAELRKSCDKHGIKLALYFSEGDWTWPGAVDGKGWQAGVGRNPEMKKAQLKELLTQYGPIEYIWFDHAVGDGGLSHAETIAFCKSLQPGCFVGFNHGDQQGADIRLGELGRPGPLDDSAAAGPYLKDAPSRAYRLAEFTYPILPPHEGGAMWFYSLPIHDALCHPADKLYRDYLGAVKFGNIFSLDVGPDYAGRLRDVDIRTLRQVGEMIRRGPSAIDGKE